ncbi:hypothetical protein ISF6_2459 [Piscinibacter sakaiensis]|uniref:Uncharacterized protein n=2 Tax=Piscinibacter sakaiensis TaxID=1547922 RepID=A0A0K8P231_PISS1|nr:hypothetical protein ISF6_2459 [Piscinibacter sakaiensis]
MENRMHQPTRPLPPARDADSRWSLAVLPLPHDDDSLGYEAALPFLRHDPATVLPTEAGPLN